MTPTRFNECLEHLHWSTETLAGILGCDESLTEAYALGLEAVPLKLEVWLKVLAEAHEAIADEMPISLKGKRYMG